MRVTISQRIQADHGLLWWLLEAGFAEVAHDDVEVHLKVRSSQVVGWLVACREAAGCGRPINYATDTDKGHCAKTRRRALELAGDPATHLSPQQLQVRSLYSYSGRAYPQLPALAKVAPGIRYLITLKIPAKPAATGDPYPRISRYQRYKTAPPVAIADWTEELVHLAAHEARHTHQFRCGLLRSEIDAERWAHARLAAYRRQLGLPPLDVDLLPQPAPES